ncbi:MAG TPA: caspase family protein [Nannocystaceae bacterium]|nr:caspase family protein [Nannocystaceae bacterium]
MSRVLAFIALLCVWWLGGDAHASEPVQVRRFALVVGANDGGDDRVVLRYASSDAKAVAKVLSQLGGVDKKDAVVVLQPKPGELRAALEEIGERIAEADADSRTQFVFYYSGHSDERGLLLAGERLAYSELREMIHDVPADVRIGVLDSCSSGAFTRTKGGKRRAPFLVSTSDVAGHAFLTSSSVDEAAQESDRVRGSFFTHFFVSALRGAADHNGDRLVTLDEAYRFAFGETLASTESSTAGAQHAAYEIALAGTGDLVMTDLRKTTAGLSLAPDVSGRVYVRDGSGNLAGELFKPAGTGSVELALEPGRYSVVVDEGGKLRRAQIALSDGRTTKLAAADLVGFQGESNTTHGAGSPEYRTIPFTMSLFPPASVNSIEKEKKVENNFAINWIVGHAARIRGVELSLGANWIDEDVRGGQLGIAANLVGTELRGVQWSAGANVVRGGLYGLQAAIGANVASTKNALDPQAPLRGWQLAMGANVGIGDFRGGQFGGLANVVTGELKGVQWGAGVSHAGRLRGGQLGLVDSTGGGRGAQIGLVNISRGRLEGAQIGLINYADDVDASIGLIPISRKGGVGGEVWTDEIATINAGVRLRARHTYAIISVGAHPFPKRLGGNMNLGLTIGGRIDVHSKVFVDLDLGYRMIVPGFREFREMPGVAVARVLVGARLGRRLALFGGPTFAVGFMDDDVHPRYRPGYQWEVVSMRRGDLRLRMWPGFAAGLQF